jgi:hypothetical protein
MTVRPITHSMTATAFAIEGYRTTRTLVTEVLCYGTAIVADRVQ